MPATLQPERLRVREFGHGTQRIHLPVDVLGRHRFRSALELGSVVVDQVAVGEPIPFKGTSILFNKRTWIGSKDSGFWEQIAPQAVTKTLLEADVRFLQNHDPNLLLARTNPQMRAAGNATLTLATATDGLKTEAEMAPVSYAQDLAVLLERGDISQMSFAFDPIDWIREQLPDGTVLITITELRLWDVSVVTYPAYEETDAGLRAAAFDALCRSGGFDPAEVLRRFAQGGDVPETAQAPPFPEAARTKDALLATPLARSLNGWALDDLWPLLDEAAVELCSTADFNAYWYVWLMDVSDEWFVYKDTRPGAQFPALYQVTYTVDADGNLTLGTPVEVVAKTSYIPKAEAPVDDPIGEPPVGDVTEFAATSDALAARTLAARHDIATRTAEAG